MRTRLLLILICAAGAATAQPDFTWMKGDSILPIYADYGTKGVVSATNKPGVRFDGVAWKGTGGVVWIFGGQGHVDTSSPAQTSTGYLNDLWKYDAGTSQWTWMHGDRTQNVEGVYGSMGVAADANKPGGRSGAVSWKDAAGNLWLFGGTGWQGGNHGGFQDLWKFGPVAGRWTWMKGSQGVNGAGSYGTQGSSGPGNQPGARSNSVAWTDGSGKLWLFGGNGHAVSGSGLLADLWRYDPALNEWAWIKGPSTVNGNGSYGTIGTPAAGNIPGAREQSVSWVDGSGRFWLFGGGGYPASGGAGDLCDLWRYDPAANQWTWMKGLSTAGGFSIVGTQGVAADANRPGALRSGHTWTDGVGDLWLFGGFGYTNALSPDTGLVSDVWKYDVAVNRWTWVKGTSTVRVPGVYGDQGLAGATNTPGSRISGFAWVDDIGRLRLYGGLGHQSSNFDEVAMNDLWIYVPVTNQWTWTGGNRELAFAGQYGTQGVAAPTNTPGARQKGTAWTDGAGNFWLFGGDGYGETRQSHLNDLWKFDRAANAWIWMKGDKTVGGAAVYGALGTAAAGNKPGARYGSVGWMDSAGRLWLFGGFTLTGYKSDLWRYDPATNMWTWMKGGSGINAAGVYGTMGTANSANLPGARRDGAAWTDAAGNFWLLGGEGYAAAASSGRLNDLWKYNPATNEWTWIKGDSTTNVTGVYGTVLTSAAGNKPGARNAGVTWSDAAGRLWLFGGNGYGSSGGVGRLNDLWRYDPTVNEWTWMKGESFAGGSAVYGGASPGTTTDFTRPGPRYGAVAWKDKDGLFWLAGGNGSGSSAGKPGDVWRYNPSTNQWTWMKGITGPNSYGVYGTKGVTSSANLPGGREYGAGWTDASGNLWLFGGNGLGIAEPPYSGLMNDLWILKLGTGGYTAFASVISNAELRDPQDDADGDGIPNFIEYVLGGSPLVSDLAILPVRSLDGTHLRLNFNRSASSLEDGQVSVEISTNLTNWTSIPAIPVTTAGAVQVDVPRNGNPKLFVRMKTVRVP
jgi:N-acetylneuraminic acid mutarotase